MALEVSNDTFYLVQLPQGKTLHNNEDEAIDYLKNKANDVNPESDDVSVVRVAVEGEDWTIAEMSWQNIALQLMGDS
ncbi:hypothetical protein [Halorussus ruber]|uniref:hypothetical protein n=1 Tax=Halorussus ruber TaxID=1126238 RepID=UPI001091F08B|nr:hypothetical protein [Halorussus ruber]